MPRYKYAAMLELQDSAIEQLSRMHPRVCPRQVLGVRIGRYGGELLGLDVPRTDKRMLAFVEMDGCFADGVSVATGCWLGRRTLRLVDYAKVAATFLDMRTQAAVRVWPATGIRTAAEILAPHAADRWHAQLEAYRAMAPSQLLNFCHVTVNVGLLGLFIADSARLTCDGCGEEILFKRYVVREGLALCRVCAGESYYTRLPGALDERDVNAAVITERGQA